MSEKEIMERIEINGLLVYPFTSKENLISFINEKKGILIAINARKIYLATDDTRKIINDNIGYADGVGALYVLKKKGYKNAVKIAGCELWLDIIRATWEQNNSYYFIGGKQDVIDRVIVNLKKDFPNINIVGYRNGYIKDDERKALIEDVCSKRPDYVFVAMGSPIQEILMDELLRQHKAVYQGLGGSFDVYVGDAQRAPEWIVEHNMEGPYRIIQHFGIARLKRSWILVKFYINAFLGRY